jgi:hypothetical protein
MMRRVPEQYLPKAIRQQADIYKLGSLQRIYEQGISALFYILPALVCLLLGGLLTGVFMLYYNSTFKSWPSWQTYMIPALAIGWYLLGSWLFLTSIFSPRVRAYIFSRGFIYHRRKTEIERWQQVEVFWKETSAHNKVKERRYTLKCADGAIFVLSSQLEEFELLAQFLDKAIKHRWLANYISAYYHGEKLDFQEIALDAQGLYINSEKQWVYIKPEKQWLPWQDFSGSKLDETTLSIYAGEKHRLWMQLPAAQIPNVEALQSLLDHIQIDLARSCAPHITAYLAGAVVNFGKLSISPEGVILDSVRETLPWSDIASIGIGDNEVIIRRQGYIREWYAVPLWTIDNATELKDLLDHIILHQYV